MLDRVQKARFIHECYGDSSLSTRKFASYVFAAMYNYEKEWNTDFSEQPTEVLQNAVNNIIGIRRQSGEHTLKVLQDYVRWRKRIDPSTGDGIFDVYVDTVNKMRERMVSSPLHLRRILDDVFDSVHEDSSDCVYRAFLWMGFSGISAEDAICVTSDDVNLQFMEIRRNGQTYPIYRESLQTFIQVCTLTYFTDCKVIRGKNVYCRTERAPGNEIMRTSTNFLGGQDGRDPLRSSIRPRIARMLSDAESRNENRESSERLNLNYGISFDRVYLSGVFYRAYEAERAGTSPDFTEQARLKMERKKAKAVDSDKQPYKETKYNSENKVMSRITRELAADYEAWKKAFST